MTDQEKADRIRKIAGFPALTIEARRQLRDVANEIAPPDPMPGTPIMWRRNDDPWQYGIVEMGRCTRTWEGKQIPLETIEWKPARILGPLQVAVDVPPVEKWNPMVESFGVYAEYKSGTSYYAHVVTYEEAKRMEAVDERR